MAVAADELSGPAADVDDEVWRLPPSAATSPSGAGIAELSLLDAGDDLGLDVEGREGLRTPATKSAALLASRDAEVATKPDRLGAELSALAGILPALRQGALHRGGSIRPVLSTP